MLEELLFCRISVPFLGDFDITLLQTAYNVKYS